MTISLEKWYLKVLKTLTSYIIIQNNCEELLMTNPKQVQLSEKSSRP